MVITRSQQRERNALVERATQAIAAGGNHALRKMLAESKRPKPAPRAAKPAAASRAAKPNNAAAKPAAPRPVFTVDWRRVHPDLRPRNAVYGSNGRVLYYNPFSEAATAPSKINWRKVNKRLLPPRTMVMPDGSLLRLRAPPV